MRMLSVLLAVVALVGLLYVAHTQRGLEARLAAMEKITTAQPSAVEEVEEIEVAEVMGRLQRFHEKWWAAGSAGNATLAAFYLHEMEESMEEIIDADVVEDGVSLAPLMRSFGVANIEKLEKILEKDGVKAMHAQGAVLVEACNACHGSAGYPFLRIRVPANSSFPDQDFTPAN